MNSPYCDGFFAGLTPVILADWLTETQVNTERGRNELAKGGRQSIATLEIPLAGISTPPGLIEPGQSVEIQEKKGSWRGCVYPKISEQSEQWSVKPSSWIGNIKRLLPDHSG